MMSLDSLPKGESYSRLLNSYVIFVCTFDPFGFDRKIYTFRQRCEEESGLALNDGETRIFLNAKGTVGAVDADINALLAYIDGQSPSGSFAKAVDEEVQKIKSGKKWGHDFMTWEMEMLARSEFWKEEGLREGIKEGQFVLAQEMALDMLKNNMPLSAIAHYTRKQLKKKQIEDLAAKHHLTVDYS